MNLNKFNKFYEKSIQIIGTSIDALQGKIKKIYAIIIYGRLRKK